MLLSTPLLLIRPVPAAGQEPVTLTVRVVDASSGRALAAALVEVVGMEARMADPEGMAEFPELSPGEHVVRVSALGYRSWERDLVLRSDTTITADLEMDPLPMDSLEVLIERRTATLRGWVKGADNGGGLPGAELVVGGLTVTADGVGGFEVSVPTGVALRVEARSPGYLPWSSEVSVTGDRRLDIELEVDPVWQRVIRRQHERLEARVQGSPNPVRTLERDDVLRHGTGPLADVLKFNNIPVGACLVIDDRVWGTGGILWSLWPDEIERIEFIRRGGMRRGFDGPGWTRRGVSMIRIYTYDYVRRELPRGGRLLPLVTGVCR